MEIQHVNPDCLHPTYCKPHGEIGPVRYYENDEKKAVIKLRLELIKNYDITKNVKVK